MTRRTYRPARRRWRSRHDPTPVLLVAEDERGFLLAALMRAAWRYRSELAPFTVGAVVAVTAAWNHHRHPGLAGPIAVLTVALSAALVVPPHRWRLGRWASRWPVIGRRSERLYATSVVALTGSWLAVATAVGPGRRPLPVVAILGILASGIPWWAHRRRRARVRVERTIAAWPQFADAISLPGSRVVSAIVDRWGWSGRLALRRGQTAGHAVAKSGEIASALGVRPGGVRVEPDPYRADHAVLRVVEADPHAQPVRWKPETVGTASIRDPISLGLFEDGRPVAVRFAHRNALVGGVVGSGKSGVLNVLLAALVACRDVSVWGVDLKGGMELGPWAPCLDRLATSPDEAVTLLQAAVSELDARAATLAARSERLWQPTMDAPALVIIVDEYAELPERASEFADSLARRGRAVAVTLVSATQRPTQKAMGRSAVRSQMDIRLCLRVRERRDTDLILGQGMTTSGWRADELDAPGKFLLSDPEHTTPRPARGYLIEDEEVRATVRRHAARVRPTVGPHTAPAGRTDREDGERSGPDEPEDVLWTLLRQAPSEGVAVNELVSGTGMSRPWLYRRLAQLAAEGRAAKVRRGRWRAAEPDEQ